MNGICSETLLENSNIAFGLRKSSSNTALAALFPTSFELTMQFLLLNYLYVVYKIYLVH